MAKSALHQFLASSFQNPSLSWIFHYEQEILRHQNQLQFILRKTLRGMGITLPPTQDPSLFWFIIFRILWEKVTLSVIQSEISKIHNPLMQKTFLPRFYAKIFSFSWEIALKSKSQEERRSLEYALPSFFLSTLSKSHALTNSNLLAQIQAIASTAETGQFGVYIPTSSSSSCFSCSFPTISEIQQEFTRYCEEHKIIWHAHPNIPQLFTIANQFKNKLVASSLIQQNLLYIAEIPSFLSIFAASLEYRASRNILNISNIPPYVLDYCAAPGSKTRLFPSFFGAQTRIVAQDFQLSRLNLVTQLFYPYRKSHNTSLNISSLSLIQADGIHPPYRSPATSAHTFTPDLILLDAPCTGSGTLYSTPELKWRQSPQFLHRHVELQRALIQNAIDLLNPGGILLYSTCSMYPEEGESQMAHFADQLDPCVLPPWFPPPYSYLGTPSKNYSSMARFSPATTNTIGFFLGLFRKI